MKLSNIFLIASFLFAAVACSMEDDVLNELTKTNPATDAEQTELYVSFNLHDSDLSTRAGESTNGGTEDDDITSASVIVFKGTAVYSVKDGVKYVEGTKNLNMQVLLKTGTAYTLYVIGNTKISFEALANKTKAEIDATIMGIDELNELVKFGQKNIFYQKTDGYPTIEAARSNVKTLDVTLSQLAAKVRLRAINVKFAEDAVLGDVSLTNVQLMNQKIQTTLDASKEGTNGLFTNTVAWGATDKMSLYTVNGEGTGIVANTGLPAPLAEFYTFPNAPTSADADTTSLAFTLDIDGRWETINRKYVINPPTKEGVFNNKTNPQNLFIQAGYIYELTVNVLVTKEDVICTLTFEVQDWDLNEVTWKYDQVATIFQNNFLTWTNLQAANASLDYVINQKAELYLNSTTVPVEGTFYLDHPVGATWYASFIPEEGRSDAFVFVDDENAQHASYSGKVGEGAKIRIMPKYPRDGQTNKAKLEIVVKTVDGRTIIVKALNPAMYGENLTNMTIIQSRN
ncbi:hypothetical protein M2137_002141 [Parabacteroides sp. PFB2-10]|uniref:fimbrial protein n=1 Tax=Parabacteroides sp. PFB2-10 TaxID=1742405 RepID=UPI00247D31AA|nr:hypothetical protein [Parabacteroides sp. PFB2-10]